MLDKMGINPATDIFEHYSLENKEKENTKSDFKNLFKEKIMEVNNLQKNSEEMTAKFAAGETDNIHQVMIAGEKAKIALNLTTAVQNKIVEAYKEVMRIQV
ncbi:MULTISPECIES: flagellar hook-basal body complex protein FliE [unclassified Halanaerobium]|uniref:flagellar hook-basal body complex protein FliE n=1 Tax=unclassified Halanaerobium TaxID=2641197 RepID=UPI000E14B509|nr:MULTISPECIES: flagellar hook-basal body complex protein FliE [unclassified Halanaerobium]RCW47696.1 flagellar hook-basal body complex protein FliE [Halanaerobium sp. MA284_MarDTE_T2]RCW84660.1 flagellar hook-basal body complex protein FliE [Halanaerobium sp. DL-01]